MNNGNQEQRSYKRFSPEAHCWAELEDADKLSIKNISLFGTCLVVPRHYDKDISCGITICSGSKGDITLKGSVIWSYPMGPSGEGGVLSYETGFKFVDMDDTQRKALQMFIEGLD